MKTATLAFLTLLVIAAAANADVLRVEVDDMIHPVSVEYIGRAIDQAAAQKADAVLIELRTPGGLDTSMRSIIEKIIKSPVPVIIWVGSLRVHIPSTGEYHRFLTQYRAKGSSSGSP